MAVNMVYQSQGELSNEPAKNSPYRNGLIVFVKHALWPLHYIYILTGAT